MGFCDLTDAPAEVLDQYFEQDSALYLLALDGDAGEIEATITAAPRGGIRLSVDARYGSRAVAGLSVPSTRLP